ncbi:MAG: RNA polymerase sigma factor [Anaerolineae bacterium]|nr:RNA polymerase sigma factor [Anaerolineae bacterium]
MEERKREGGAAHEDGRLLAQARQGNLRAFEALYEKYKNMVYRAALTITRDPDAAEDILQDCFLRLHAHMDSLDGSYPIGPWLYRVTVNLCYNWATRRRRIVAGEEPLEAMEGPHADLPEATFARHELRAAVEQALEHLSLNHRLVIALYYLGGFSLEEIAYILDCPMGTVKSRLHYARLRLRELLGEEAGQPLAEAWRSVRG